MARTTTLYASDTGAFTVPGQGAYAGEIATTWSPPFLVDSFQNPCDISFGLFVVDGAPNVHVQHCFDDPFADGFNVMTAGWIDHVDFSGVALSGPSDGNYAFPIRLMRLTCTGGTAKIEIVQAGPRR